MLEEEDLKHHDPLLTHNPAGLQSALRTQDQNQNQNLQCPLVLLPSTLAPTWTFRHSHSLSPSGLIVTEHPKLSICSNVQPLQFTQQTAHHRHNEVAAAPTPAGPAHYRQKPFSAVEEKNNTKLTVKENANKRRMNWQRLRGRAAGNNGGRDKWRQASNQGPAERRGDNQWNCMR